jgi:spore germination cell wall hydrolase CwlJ-like protein
MKASRCRSKGNAFTPFGLCALAFALLPAPIGSQDLAAFLVPEAAAAPRQPALSSPFGTIHLATFSLPQPLGTAMPKPPDITLTRLEPSDIDVSDSPPFAVATTPVGPIVFPAIDRRRKGDLLLPASEPSPGRETAREPLIDSIAEPIGGVSLDDGVWPEFGGADTESVLNPAINTARLYFGAGSMDAPLGTLDRSLLEVEAAQPAVATTSPHVEIKQSVLAPASAPDQPPPAENASRGGESTATKGGADSHRLPSPAERLRLSDKARARAERCLANAVYFESRGEPVRGQIAVAQVVMNRVFSDFYPDNVCDVVYQNARRHLACQFTFACDGIPDVVTEPEAWRRATRIAKDMLDGKLWLDEVGKATHYHAYWVRPSWVHEMKKLYKLGVHTFYRPRAWGNGADEPNWGDAKTTAVLAKTL